MPPAKAGAFKGRQGNGMKDGSDGDWMLGRRGTRKKMMVPVDPAGEHHEQ